MVGSRSLNSFVSFKKAVAIMVSCTLFLSACGTTGGGPMVGPAISSELDEKKVTITQTTRPGLDVIIPVFDPGLPAEEDYAEEGIWPELRRAEASHFALMLKDELEKTNKFGAVRVTPNKHATGDIYIMGVIDESDGESVEISLELYDISGERWFSKSFDHTVNEQFHNNYRNKGKDAYRPVFKEAAAYIVEQLEDYSAKEIESLKNLTAVRFGANFSEETFAQYLETDGDSVTLIGMPSKDDPMLVRTKAIRVRDELFIDQMQLQYEAFDEKMRESYGVWQKESQLEVKAASDARMKSIGQAVVGALAIGLAIAAASSNSNNNYSFGKDVAAVMAGIGGGVLLSESFKTSEEARFHREALEELGKSIDIELAPQVVEFEKKTVELTGNANQQFSQWREFLKEIYREEAIPDKQL